MEALRSSAALDGHRAVESGARLTTTHQLEQQAMQASRTVASLFQDAPSQWGLPGDPYLWREMKATLGDHMDASTEEQLVALLEQAYQQLTGRPLTDTEPIFVERYSHGGMSSGYVSPQ